MVKRDALIARLNAGLSKPLTLVSAAAGFGKTTLIASWLDECDCASAWLALDHHDRDLDLFLRYVITALRTIAPGAGARTLELVQAGWLPDIHTLVKMFSNDLAALSSGENSKNYQRILVLDDFHLAASPEINEFVSVLTEHPPTTLHLVIVTRSDPPLPLSRLRANNQLNEFRMRDLRFSSDETAEFMRQSVGETLEADLLASLVEKTEGWAASLRLVALALRSSRDAADDIVELLDDNRRVMDYLGKEVFSTLSPDDRQFLLGTALLDPLTGSLCDAVLDEDKPIAGSAAQLEALRRANFFTFALDAQPGWYRYHHLFKALLLAELAQRYDATQIAALHTRAGMWHAAHGNIDEAIYHAQAAGDEAMAIDLVQTHRHKAMDREDWPLLGRWFGLFKRETIDARPELLLLEAWLFQLQVQPAQIAPLLRRAELVMQHNPPPELLAKTLQGEIDTLDAYVAFYALDPERGLAAAQRALATVPVEHSNVRGNAWIWQAGAFLLAGNVVAAKASLLEGLHEDREDLKTFATRLLLALANLYWWTTDLKYLVQTGKHLGAVAQARHLPESLIRAHYHAGLGYYQQNELALAEQEFAAVVQQPYLAYPIVFVQSAIGLASVHLARGESQRAAEVMEKLSAYALQRNNAQFIEDVEAFTAHYAIAQGRAFEVEHWLATQEQGFRRMPLIKLRDPSVTLAEVLIADGRPESLRRAADLLPRLHEFVSSIHSTRYLIEVLALEALLHEAREESAAAVIALRKAVTLGQPGGIIRVFADLGPKMGLLLHKLPTRDIAPDYLRRLLAAFGSLPAPSPQPDHADLIEPLTDREMEVLTLLGQRMSNKEIAQTLFISHLTVKRHTSNIYQKLAVTNRREAIAKAVQLGLVLSAAPRFLS